jgi:hypothetical protein
MIFYKMLAPAVQYFRKNKRAADILLQQHIDSKAIDHAKRGIELFLGLPEDESLALATKARNWQKKIYSQKPRLTLGLTASEKNLLLNSLQQGSCLLALPFNVNAVQLLKQLPDLVKAPIVLIESPGVFELVTALQLNKIKSCASKDVIKKVKADAKSEDGQTLYLSFPELHPHTKGTAAKVEFLGKPCHFSLLESLLFFQGIKTLMTLTTDVADTHANNVKLVAYMPNNETNNTLTQALQDTLLWLVQHLQRAAQTIPSQTFSWQYLFQNSEHCQMIEYGDQLKQIDAFFEAWKTTGADLDEKTYAFAKTYLSKMRQTALQ